MMIIYLQTNKDAIVSLKKSENKLKIKLINTLFVLYKKNNVKIVKTIVLYITEDMFGFVKIIKKSTPKI